MVKDKDMGRYLRNFVLMHHLTHLQSAGVVTEEESNAISLRICKRERPSSESFAKAFYGQWPGDETDEQVIKTLEEIE